MVRHWIAVLLVVALVPVSSVAEQASEVESIAGVDRDIRVFTVVAALNVAGFDVEFAPRYHPVREALRERLRESVDPDLRNRLAEYYAENRGDTAHEDEFSRYISLALNLTDPPDMELVTGDQFLPPDARGLEGFVELLNEFYSQARISQIWVQLAPAYDEVLDALAGPLRAALVRTDAYLRMPPGSTGGRRLAAILELAAPINSVQVRNYSENMYVVFGYAAQVPVEDVRHAYLHLLLDPLVNRSREDLSRNDGIMDLLAGVEGVRPEYAEDFQIMVSESLIRAVELRTATDASRRAALMDTAYRSGLLLTPFFVDRLAEFEDIPTGIREFFPEIVMAIDASRERARFQERFQEIELVEEVRRPAEVPEPPPSDPVQDLLVEGQKAFNSGDDAAARNAFETVLYQHDSDSGPALYGLALLASRDGDSDAARNYFRRTLESESSEPSMRVWSHVFLGRILDIECDRDAALAEYKAAVDLGDDTNGAQAAARRGIAGPFGGGCDL